MGGEVVRIAIEELFGDVDGFDRIGAQGNLPLGEQRRAAGSAEHFSKKTAFAARLFGLSGPQRLAAGVEARLLLQHLRENGDRVVEVLALEGSQTFFVLLPQRAGNGCHTLFRHVKTVAIIGPKSTSITMATGRVLTPPPPDRGPARSPAE